MAIWRLCRSISSGLLVVLALACQAMAEVPAQTMDALAARQAEIIRLYTSGDLQTALNLVDPLLADIDKEFGHNSVEYAAMIGGIKGGLLQDLGRFEEALEANREAARITRKVVGPTSAYHLRDLGNLADLLRSTGRLQEAIDTYREAADLAAGNAAADVTTMRVNAMVGLGEVLRRQHHLDDAEKVLTEALTIAKSPPVESLELVAGAVSNRSLVHMDQGKFELALAKLDQVVPLMKGQPIERSNLGLTILSNRAALLSKLGRHDEAVAQARSNLAFGKAAFPKASNWLAQQEGALGAMLVASGKLEEGKPLLVNALTVASSKEERIADLVAPAFEEQTFRRVYLAALAQALMATAMGKEQDFMFQALDVLSRASTERAVRQLGVRAAARDTGMAADVRVLQDVEAEIVAARKRWFSLPVSGSDDEIRLRRSLADLLHRHDALEQKIRSQTPAWAEVDQAGREPTTLAGVRAALSKDDALVWFVSLQQPLPLAPEMHAWVITVDGATLVPVDLTLKDAADHVAVLRCGLDKGGNWEWSKTQKRWIARNDTCKNLKPDGLAEDAPLPFDAVRAHAFYRALFGRIEATIASKKHLLIVPTGPLAQLPFQVLVTSAPGKSPQTFPEYRDVRWFARSHAITVLPAVSSLLALGQAGASPGTKPYLGLANPLLDGKDKVARQAAIERTRCGTLPAAKFVEVRNRGLGPDLPELRGGMADPSKLRQASPLPETADEVCAVAKMLGATEDDVRLGARNVEPDIQRLSKEDQLRAYRIVHFATHGALAGEASGSTEPGLILTPPATATETDDGYLSASEVMALKLDADWVILSACNTAAGEARDTEALSGLARAFFYAGARALLVSHWSVDSDATVALITGTFAELSASPDIGRAEALRRSMLALIDKSKTDRSGRPDDSFAHPAYWAPFIVVGNGGAARNK